MCGMLSPTWWPNTIQATLPIKRFYLIYQILATSWILPPTLTLCFIIYEAGGLIDVRIDHLKEVYDNIFETDNEEEQFKRFKLWVRYHQDIIGLCEHLNRISKRTIGHVLLIAAIVMGCIGNQLIKTLDIRDTIYEGKWYMCDERVKSWMPFVLLRCQKPMSLDALPLGSANYPLFLLIIKTTYSYITLLNQVV
ncbi:uncharacterized protein LOC115875627 [Sitophilus oryzae]|uniref:Uncharacterized protein LOC115875627 n=1 Tax=Sitophilus oryzae TaxID=7048 RepID=A0A6J2X729_SITOR|nr:uncharacterized protein LOC115875627 [Sitophilus oryzae]